MFCIDGNDNRRNDQRGTLLSKKEEKIKKNTEAHVIHGKHFM